MALSKTHAVAVAAVFILGSCSSVSDSLFPSLTPDNGASSTMTGEPGMDGAASGGGLSLGQPTGTFVGHKVQALRNDLLQLRSTLASQNDQLKQIRSQATEDSTLYNGTVAAINTRLELGTTPGNPILQRQWNEAQTELGQINNDVLTLNRLTSDVAATSSMAAYLLDSVRAARTLSGAVDEDHRQLRVLEDETNTTTVTIERLLNEISVDAQRQQQYVTTERSNLNTLAVAIKNGQFYGSSLANVRLNSAPTNLGADSPVPAERPLVVIRFDRPHVSYEDALYTAVKSALDRRPDAVFDVVAVSPSQGSAGRVALSETASRRNADSVIRSLTQMGLPQDRIRLSAATSQTARSSEVQVFVR